MKKHRVLLHNHSNWSDGRMSLVEIARLGERLHASAVVMSEHDYFFTEIKWNDYTEACRAASTRTCVVIPGIEYSSPDDDFHVITVGTSCFLGARQHLVQTLSAVRAAGGAAVLAHPRRRGCFEKIDAETLALLDGIEIWNRKVDGFLPTNTHFKFAQEHGLATTVGMDLHTWRQIFPMWNELQAESEVIDGNSVAMAIRKRTLSPACVIGGIESGLDGDFSIALATLTSAEWLRRLLRDTRDAFRPR